MILPFKLAQRFRLAVSLTALLALGQAAAMADPPYSYPEPSVPPPPQALRDVPESLPAPRPLPPNSGSQPLYAMPVLNTNPQAVTFPLAEPVATDRPLPINLATALYLSNARPLVIAFAQNSVELAAAQLQRAKVLWLPNLNAGVDYFHHEGADQTTPGLIIQDTKSYFAAGAGATFDFGITDAIFLPLVARQQLFAREFDLQAA